MNEFTEEQRAAVKRVRDAQGPGCGELTHPRWRDVQTILNLLPTELTNPQPLMPTEPGIYSDQEGRAWALVEDTGWVRTGVTGVLHVESARAAGPMTRLVPERPQITAAEIDEAWLGTRNDASIPRHLDGSISAVDAFRAGFRAGFRAATENGTDRD